jgi:hypothetical protein
MNPEFTFERYSVKWIKNVIQGDFEGRNAE